MKAEKSSAEQSVRQPLSPRINKAVAFTLSARLELSAALKWKRGEWDRERHGVRQTLWLFFFFGAEVPIDWIKATVILLLRDMKTLLCPCRAPCQKSKHTWDFLTVTLILDDLTYGRFKLRVCSIRSNVKRKTVCGMISKLILFFNIFIPVNDKLQTT